MSRIVGNPLFNASNLLLGAGVSTAQLSNDALLTHFSHQASEPTQIMAMMVGGLSSRFGNILFRSLSPAFIQRNSFLINAGAQVTSLASEVLGFEMSSRTLTVLTQGYSQNSNLFHWRGEGGISHGLGHSFVNFGTLRIFGQFGRSNILAQHAAQDLGMVTGHRLASQVGLEDRSNDGFLKQMLSAEVTNLQMGVGMILGHVFTGGRVQFLERNLERVAMERSVDFSPGLLSMSNVAPSKSLRPYQREASDAGVTAFKEGRDRGLIVLPTGTGKTVIASDFISRFLREDWSYEGRSHPSRRVLVLSHRDEIVTQNGREFSEKLGKDKVGIHQAGNFDVDARPIHDIHLREVVSASVQSVLQGRLNLEDFGLVVLDEAHHYVHGNDWFEPLIKMGFFDAEGNIISNPNRFMMGFTATPDRLTGKPLNTTFGVEGLLFERDLSWMLGKGYLLEPHGVELQLQVEGVQDPAEAYRRAKIEDRSRWMAEFFYERLHHRDKFQRTTIFTDSIGSVKHHTQNLNKEGVRTLGITEDTVWYLEDGKVVEASGSKASRLRRDLIAAYKRGEYDALVNVNIATEGFDDPGTEAVILDITTNSRSRIVQMVGRSLRLDPNHPERKTTWVIDFGGNLRRHRLSIPIREIYNVGEKNQKATPEVAPDRERNSLEEARDIDDVTVEELGALVATRSESFLSRALRDLLPTAEAVKRLAYRMGLPSDELFRWWNDVEIPSSSNRLLDVARQINDSSRLADAWTQDKVAEMNVAKPLGENLSIAERELAELSRWALWRYYDGDISAMAVKPFSPIITYLESGQTFQKNIRITVRQFYDELIAAIALANPSLRERAQKAVSDSIRAERGWDVPVPGLAPPIQDLLDCYREALIERYAGCPSYDDITKSSQLRCFCENGELPLKNSGKLTLRAFYNQMLGIMAREDQELRTQTQKKIRAAVRTQRGWDKIADALPAATRVLYLHFTDSVIDQWGGEIPVRGEGGTKEQGPLRNFIETGVLPSKNTGNFKLLDFFADLETRIAGEDVEQRRIVREEITAAVRTQRGWNVPLAGLLPEVQALHNRFREAVLERYGFEDPWSQDDFFGRKSYEGVFLHSGELPKNNTTLGLRAFYDRLIRWIARDNALLASQLAFEVTAVIRVQRGWDKAVDNLHPHIQILLNRFRNRVIELWAGEIPNENEYEIYSTSPLFPFLESGTLPLTGMPNLSLRKFYDQMTEVLAGDNSELRAVVNNEIRSAIMAQRGWDRPVESLGPETQNLLSRFREGVIEVKGGNLEVRYSNHLKSFLGEGMIPKWQKRKDHNALLFFEDIQACMIGCAVPREEAVDLVVKMMMENGH